MDMPALLGYAASALIALSLMMTNVLRLRMINLSGAGLFTAYGLLVDALPVAVVNGFICLINLIFLVRIYARKQVFELVYAKDPHASYPHHFASFWADDIRKFFPRFALDEHSDAQLILITRDSVPVGLFVHGPYQPSGGLEIHLDYVVPAYRDFKAARFLTSQGVKACREKACTHFYLRDPSAAHRRSLRRLGFSPDPDGHTWSRPA